ncbi:MAG: RES family NAD+ phosphorylase [Cyclobacteriaceae bacterium]|nr:RES family NAD+ phosphorylase [Cyclobacteriaceae bacterium]
MIIYRLARTEFCDVSGEGAKRYGGRWNLPGQPALYGCNSVSAAMLERLTIDPELFAAERYVLYSIMEFTCPDELVTKPALSDLPEGWNAIPASQVSMDFGTGLLKKGILCFRVPSVVDPSSDTLVLNPVSKDFKRVKWKVYPLRLDQRIVR